MQIQKGQIDLKTARIVRPKEHLEEIRDRTLKTKWISSYYQGPISSRLDDIKKW